MVMMLLLALMTYWMVRIAPVFEAPGPARALTHDPDYFMKDFAVRSFDAQGRLKSEIFGAQAQHFSDTQTLEIDQIRIRSISEQGRLSTATAKRALTNEDGSEVQLFGDARVVREAALDAAGKPLARIEFQGEFLHAFLQAERLSSHQPVTIVRGQDRFTADAMEFDNLDRVVDLRGRVRGTLMPSAAQ
jgi:lipopolysaccharide export system protein LptC